MAWLGLIVSIACLVGASVVVARALARPGADRFWVGIAAAPAQIGVLGVLSSSLHRFEAWAFLALQIGLTAIVAAMVRWRGCRKADAGHALGPAIGRDPVCMALAAAIGLLLVMSAVQQAVTPVWGWDEGNYHGPRIAYWLQNRTIFVWSSHNDRQTVFPFGAELFVAWPLLFVKAEWLGRMAFWTAFPATAAGLWIVARTIGAGTRAALGGVLLYVATPTVLFHAESLKSDGWLPLFVLGAAYAAIRARSEKEPAGERFFLSGFLLALAINIKAVALALLPGILFVAALELARRRLARCLAGLASGVLLGAMLSGLALLLVVNESRYHRPLGPAGLSALVRPQASVEQMLVHAVRVPFILFELPEIPVESVRAWLHSRGQHLAEAAGATTPLQWEDVQGWPGRFEFVLPGAAVNYSLGGLLWLPVLGIWLGRAARTLVRTWPRLELERAEMLAVLQVPLLLGVVFMIRWMIGGPCRFWLGAYALAIPLIAKLAGDLVGRKLGRATVVACVLMAAVYPVVRDQVSRIESAVASPRPDAVLDYPYQEVTPLLPHGAGILLFAGSSTREYGLFNPRGGFTNRVYLWGLSPFDPGRAQAMLKEHRISHIVIEDDRTVGSNWGGYIFTDGVVSWAARRDDFRELPLKTPHMRLFERTNPPVTTR